MAEPNEYISVTRKNFLADDKGRMVEKSFLEIQGTFLVKIRDNTFNGIIRENAFKHIDNFLEVVGPLKIKGLSQDRFRLSIFPISLAEMETDEDDDPDDIVEIFKTEDNLFDFEKHLCKAFNEFNYLLKIDTDLFTFDIQGIKTYEEYELNNNMIGDLEEPCSDINGFYNGGELPRMVRVGCMTYFQDHKWYDELTEGKLKEEALMRKARFEESWGDSTPGVMKFCAWLKSSFENFHKLYYDVLVKLEECWWKINAHENALFARWENHGIIKQTTPYVAIKERKHSDHSRTNVDACQAYRELFRIMDVGWLMKKAKEE
ncbi:hypothetical protein Tco_1334627 [Tanacetum coccineum]